MKSAGLSSGTDAAYTAQPPRVNKPPQTFFPAFILVKISSGGRVRPHAVGGQTAPRSGPAQAANSYRKIAASEPERLRRA